MFVYISFWFFLEPKLPKPKHQNATLEKLIAERKDETELSLSWKKLTDEDMEIVAYYALQENRVSNAQSTVRAGERNGNFIRMFYL